MTDYEDILRRAHAIALELHPGAEPERHTALANSVAYAVTGTTGGESGPSVRELAAWHLLGDDLLDFDTAVERLGGADGPIFGPLTDLHRELARINDCFGDDPDDLRKLGS